MQTGIDPKKYSERVHQFIQQLFLEIIYDLSSSEDADLFSAPAHTPLKISKGPEPRKNGEIGIVNNTNRPPAAYQNIGSTAAKQIPIVIDDMPTNKNSLPLDLAPKPRLNNNSLNAHTPDDEMEVDLSQSFPFRPRPTERKSTRSKRVPRLPFGWTKEPEDAKTVSLHYSSDENSDSGTEEYSTSELWHLNTIFTTATGVDV
mgnify:CR=1 FL=1